MSEEEFDRDVLGDVPQGRRAFVKRMLIGAAFAVPTVVSFNMVGLSAASAAANTSNQRGPKIDNPNETLQYRFPQLMQEQQQSEGSGNSGIGQEKKDAGVTGLHLGDANHDPF